MIVFHSDLDNTLIYSYRHDIGEEKIHVEFYEGRKISFMTRRSSLLLKQIQERAVFVPTTTRTEEQYRRIDLKTGVLDYALVCNGGILLRAGKELPEWYEESLRLTEKSRGEFACAESCMQKDSERILEVRNIRNLFLFTKSREPSELARRLKENLDPERMEVFCHRSKVYAMPKGLDKGTAVRRFKAYIKADVVFSAGDSEFDLPMLEEADYAWAPEELTGRFHCAASVKGIAGDQIFSDAMLEKVLAEVSGIKYGGHILDGNIM